MICKISNFNVWTSKHLAQVSCTELTLKENVCICWFWGMKTGWLMYYRPELVYKPTSLHSSISKTTTKCCSYLGKKQGKLKWGMSDDDVTVRPWLPFKKKIADLFVLNSYIDKCSEFIYHHKSIITTSTFDVKFKENNENDMTFVVWAGSFFGPRLWQLSVCRRYLAGKKYRNLYTQNWYSTT